MLSLLHMAYSWGTVALQMEELDLAWQIYGALKATGMEPADYPPINAWMASQVLAGLDPATRTWHDWQPEVLNHFLCAALLPALHLGWNTLQ